MESLHQWILLGPINIALWIVSCRVAYGSWPWEARKAWYWTEGELQYLRDLQSEGKL